LLEHLRTQGNFSVLFVLTPQGDHYISHPFSVQRSLKKYNLSDRPYFQQASKTRALVLSDSFVGSDGIPAVAIDLPVLNSKGEIVLHLGGVLHLSRLSALLATDKIAPFDRAVLVDRVGKQIANSDPNQLSRGISAPLLSHPHLQTLNEAPLENAVVTQKILRDTIVDANGERWLSFVANTDADWHLFLFRNERLLLAEIDPQVRQATLIAALILLIPSLLGLWMALRYGRRWHRSDAALRDANTQLESRIKERTDELQRSEIRHRTLFESAVDAVLVMTPERYIDCNPAAVALFGATTTADILLKHPSTLSPEKQANGESSRVQANLLLAQMMATADAKLSFEWTHRRLDNGQNFIARVNLSRMDIDGQALIQVNLRDMTATKRAQEALRIAATAFESQEGMAVTDSNLVFLQVNPAFCRITGYSAQEAVGQTPRLLQSGRHEAAFYAELWNALNRFGMWQGEIWNRRKSGEVYPEWITISAVKDERDQTTHYVAVFTDITSHKEAENQIQHLAFYDPLTQLPNRRLLMDRLEQAITASARHLRLNALLFVDLDNFKTINETLGHLHGDQLLTQVAIRLSHCVRDGDSVARLGGDEFVVILEDLSENAIEAANQAEAVAEKIRLELSLPYVIEGANLLSTPSIGVALFGGSLADTAEDPIKRAELAMYQAKAAGRNTVRFFDPKMQAVVTARATLETDLREALVQGQLTLHYQAQVVGDGRITGAEALVRWAHPVRGNVSPVEFIPLAEETGLILPLGQWVLETACRQLALWADHDTMAPLTLAVNVSARQFHHPDFVAHVAGVLEHTGANPKRLKLELTESLLVADVEDIIAKMATLKARGVGFSLDDFGTGYSSLSYLKRLPLDQLKIDQGFVRNILTDANDASIAKMVVALAESLGLSVIAEGVEMEAQRDFLARLGCHAYQGFYFSRPVPVEQFSELVLRAA
jgi:diguanylate cyclase (GGDEF)-like protein/PAS domain S-box-containing protein